MSLAARPLLLLATLLLSSCTAGEQPRTADVVAPSPAHQDFGDLRVHYNTLPTLAMSEAVAREYSVERDGGQALVTVALRTLANGEEIAAEGEVSAVAVDLQGMRQSIAFRPVRTGGYIDYIGSLRVTERDSYRFEVFIKSGQRSGKVKFQRNF